MRPKRFISISCNIPYHPGPFGTGQTGKFSEIRRAGIPLGLRIAWRRRELARPTGVGCLFSVCRRRRETRDAGSRCGGEYGAFSRNAAGGHGAVKYGDGGRTADQEEQEDGGQRGGFHEYQ